MCKDFFSKQDHIHRSQINVYRARQRWKHPFCYVQGLQDNLVKTFPEIHYDQRPSWLIIVLPCLTCGGPAWFQRFYLPSLTLLFFVFPLINLYLSVSMLVTALWDSWDIQYLYMIHLCVLLNISVIFLLFTLQYKRTQEFLEALTRFWSTWYKLKFSSKRRQQLRNGPQQIDYDWCTKALPTMNAMNGANPGTSRPGL